MTTINFEYTFMTYDLVTLLKIIAWIGLYSGVIIYYKIKMSDSFVGFVAYAGLLFLLFLLLYFIIGVQ